MINIDNICNDLCKIREISPLVHNITNYVAMNFSANALLAIGASPVMAHEPEEMEQMASIVGALVINIGTLDQLWVEAMLISGEAMSKLSKPIVFDPVGAGATAYRTRVSWQIIERCKPTIIRGNASEIMALVDAGIISKGVDSSHSSDVALESAKWLAKQTGAVVVISGETDYITDGDRVEAVLNGSKMMTRVTAMGCTASSMIGVFAAVNSDPFEAAVNAMAVMSISGEVAATNSIGSGSLQINFIDELYNINSQTISKYAKL